ncbi:MAG: response regulator [Pseudomonadota bacterium]
MKLVCTEDFDYHNYTILVVDNSPDHLDLTVKYLSDCGFQIIVAGNGETALALARTKQPDLILLDAILPGMDGFQTCYRLKEDEKTRHIMVIFMTGLTQTENKLKGFDLGAVDYITKPFHQEELLARVTTHLKLKDLTENLEEKVQSQTRELLCANNMLHNKIEERKKVEAELRESESRYRAVIENSNDGIVILEAGKIVFFNEKLLSILGYDRREELIGKDVEVLFHPDEKERICQYNKRREAGQPAPEQYEAQGKTKDGQNIYFGVSATRITYQNRVAVLGFLKDLTRHKRLERQLQQSQKMEAIGTLAGGIAHDFNNILNIIIGHTELILLDDTIQEGSVKYLHRVMAASHRASELIRQILTFSRQKGVEAKPLKISLLIKETLKMLRASLPSTIEIREEIRDSESLVMADSTQIHQVLMNLCTNAAYAMPEQDGVLQVMLDRVEINQADGLNLVNGPYMKLSVCDNGSGMDTATQKQIFDPYFTTKKLGEGTGLGLAVVHGIITGYKGTIKVTSQPGSGSQFDLYLPVNENPVIDQEIELTLEELPRGREHILFVDDEEMVVTLYEDMMSFLGYRITATSSSQDAWQLFKANPDSFDMVITDLTMPHLAGDELSKKMLSLRPDIPIILCTGHSNRLTPEEIEQIGIRQFLMKPMILDHLAFTIRDVLDTDKVKQTNVL